jgi:hypothetical protein
MRKGASHDDRRLRRLSPGHTLQVLGEIGVEEVPVSVRQGSLRRRSLRLAQGRQGSHRRWALATKMSMVAGGRREETTETLRQAQGDNRGVRHGAPRGGTRPTQPERADRAAQLQRRDGGNDVEPLTSILSPKGRGDMAEAIREITRSGVGHIIGFRLTGYRIMIR